MNKTVKTPVTKAPTNSLGQAQTDLEKATRELQLAQAAFLKAQERLDVASEAHATATVVLASAVNTVRNNAKVTPLALR